MKNEQSSGVSRRNAVKSAGLLLASGGLARGVAPTGSANTFSEPAQSLKLVDDVDVIVCGAGPAGVAAAISAARTGASVRLFEAHGCLGGIWTAGLLGYLIDFDKPGFTRELVRKLRERDAHRGKGQTGLTYEPEEMKVLLEELCKAAGIKIQLHTRVAAAYRDGGRLRTIVTESKAGRQAWRAKVFIDTTGDGDLGAQSGCEWEIGQAADCPCQPMSMTAMLVVKDAKELAHCIHPSGTGHGKDNGATKRAFLAEIRRAGFDPSYGMPTMFPVRDNLVLVMINHEYGIKPFDIERVTEATLRARAEIHGIVHGLRKLGGPWEGIQIAATPEQIGIRDGRRIRGRYTVKAEDLVKGARHVDSVVRPTFTVDIHALSLEANKKAAYSNGGVRMKPYDIPLRALIARDVDGLMMAGRCISGDFISHASYRVTGNAVAMGEAAGVTSALAASGRVMPHEVEWKQVGSILAKMRSEKSG